MYFKAKFQEILKRNEIQMDTYWLSGIIFKIIYALLASIKNYDEGKSAQVIV